MDYYQILEVDKKASASEIKKAFHKKALKLHPDKNEDKEKAGDEFKRVKKAYEVLSNAEKKQMYDLYGEEADIEIPNVDVNSMFEAVFKSFPMGGNTGGSSSFVFEAFPQDIMGAVFGEMSPETMNIFGNLGNLSSMGDINVFMNQFKEGVKPKEKEASQEKKIVEEFEIELPMSMVYKGKMSKIPFKDQILEIPSWKKRWETADANYTFQTVRDGKSFERLGNILVIHKKVHIDYLLEGKEDISVVFPNNEKIRVKTGWDEAKKNGKELKMRLVIPNRGFWDDERVGRDDAQVIISVGLDKKHRSRKNR